MGPCGRLTSAAFVTNDIEVFVGCRGLEIRCDRVEFGVRCPSRAGGKPFAAFLELPLAYVVRCIDEMQLVFRTRPLA